MKIRSDNTELLIQQSQDGDKAAFGLLMHQHQDYAFRLAYRLLSCSEESRDVVQESFIRVWQHLDTFRKHHRFTTWLYRIVVNLATDRLRQRQRRPSITIDKVPEIADDSASAQVSMEQRETAARIESLARTLPEKQRLVFILRDLEDRTVEETATILKIGKGAVKSHLHLARRKIRKALEDDHV
ncbi:RNA polymerase sigma factor [bacterium]|nr:RNA polymerase sigma factor [bacterium]